MRNRSLIRRDKCQPLDLFFIKIVLFIRLILLFMLEKDTHFIWVQLLGELTEKEEGKTYMHIA